MELEGFSEPVIRLIRACLLCDLPALLDMLDYSERVLTANGIQLPCAQTGVGQEYTVNGNGIKIITPSLPDYMLERTRHSVYAILDKELEEPGA